MVAFRVRPPDLKGQKACALIALSAMRPLKAGSDGLTFKEGEKMERIMMAMALLLVLWLILRTTHRRTSDLGFVSERWLSERVRVADHAP